MHQNETDFEPLCQWPINTQDIGSSIKKQFLVQTLA